MIVDDTFVYWATERDAIRRRRESGETGPWTDDPIFRNHRFCNVSREDDRVTRWIAEHLREPFSDHPELPVILTLARFVNLPETLADMIPCFAEEQVDLPGCDEIIRARMARKLPAYRGAYMIRAEHVKERPWYSEPKSYYICRIVAGGVREALPALRGGGCTREAWTTSLAALYGFGTFMAGQVVADLAYTRWLENAPDHMTWAPKGPGAVRGMNRALGRPIQTPMGQEEYLNWGKAQLGLLPRELVEDRRLTLHDVASNVNCETDKYLRIKNGEGSTRKYP